MLKNFVANLRPYKRAHYFVHADYNTFRHAVLNLLALDGEKCKVYDENSRGTTFKIYLAYSAN